MSQDFLAALDGDKSQQAAQCISEYTRHKMRFIDHIPLRYYLPDKSVQLQRLYAELTNRGHIEMHPDRWVPACLVADGLE